MFRAFHKLVIGSRFYSHGTLWRKVSRRKAERADTREVRKFRHGREVWLETTAD